MRRILGLLLILPLVVAVPSGAADAPAAPQTLALSALIDKHLDARLASEKVPASPACSDAEFLRRACLDVTGRIPTAKVAEAFLDSGDPDKRAKLVDALLASKDYGTHFGTVWRNLIVRPDANMLRPPDTAPLVAWMAGQFNANKGWDVIVRDMLTVEGAKPEGLFFSLNGDSRGNPQANVVAGSVGQLFMGVQMACAECHNHPFADEWKQNDFWGVAAFFGRVNATGAAKGNFAGMNITETAKAGGKRNAAPKTVGSSIVIPDTSFKQIGKRVNAKLPHGTEPKLDAGKPFRPAFADWLVAKDNPFFAKNAVNRLWAHFFGRGFVNPLGEMSDLHPPSHPELLDALAKDYAASGFDQKRLVRAVVLSRAYQRTSKPLPGNKTDEALFSRMAVKVVSAEVLHDSLLTALSVDTLFPAPAKKAAAKKKNAAANRFPAASSKQKFLDFYTTRDADGDPTDYTHGIPQALRLMNAELFNTGGGTVEAAMKLGPADKVVEGLYLSVLSRRPDPVERDEALAYVAKQKTARDGYRGVFWALLNSAEFIVNR